MKILTLHVDSIEIVSTKQAVKDADEEHGRIDAKEALVAFCAVEKADEAAPTKIAEKAVAEIDNIVDQVKAKEVVVYPYVHLTAEPSNIPVAKQVLEAIASGLREKQYKVQKAPFGWYKAFTVKAKGHPLAELSRTIAVGEVAKPMKEDIKKRAGKAGKPTIHSTKELEEYAEHDHRRIGKELDLFSFHEFAPGQPFFHQKGLIVLEQLKDFMRSLLESHGYQLVSAPILWSQEVYEKSGHWDNYRENMFIIEADGRFFAPKPMNCPGHAAIFKTHTRSYRDLPLRYAEWTTLYRNELSGVLSGLFRVLSITQDDAHIYCTEEQVEKEIDTLLELVDTVYKVFGMPYRAELSTKPEKRIGSDELWAKAESTLESILKKSKVPYKVNAGDGAFYGPKIDIHVTDSLGRSWQCATIQLDFVHGDRFGVTYADADGKEKRPVVIHRTIYGSYERFLGVLLEHYSGKLPLWLAPVQVAVLPLSEKHVAYSTRVFEALKKHGLRVEHLSGSETLEYRVREAQVQKIPYVLVVGEKEEVASTVAVRPRLRTGGVRSTSEQGSEDDGKVRYGVKTQEFIDAALEEIARKA